MYSSSERRIIAHFGKGREVKVISVDFRGRNMSAQDIGSALLLGWEAARKGEPFDASWGWHARQGFRLYQETHQQPKSELVR